MHPLITVLLFFVASGFYVPALAAELCWSNHHEQWMWMADCDQQGDDGEPDPVLEPTKRFINLENIDLHGNGLPETVLWFNRTMMEPQKTNAIQVRGPEGQNIRWRHLNGHNLNGWWQDAIPTNTGTSTTGQYFVEFQGLDYTYKWIEPMTGKRYTQQTLPPGYLALKDIHIPNSCKMSINGGFLWYFESRNPWQVTIEYYGFPQANYPDYLVGVEYQKDCVRNYEEPNGLFYCWVYDFPEFREKAPDFGTYVFRGADASDPPSAHQSGCYDMRESLEDFTP